jgi:hypothetical protein
MTLLPHTEIAALDGDKHVERMIWHNNQTGETATGEIAHVFIMTVRFQTQRGLTTA